MPNPPDYFLDITGELCPLTFVRTKLLLERMPAGSIAVIRLKGLEPLRNVPHALALAGHEIISKKREDETGDDPYGVHILTVRKTSLPKPKR